MSRIGTAVNLRMSIRMHPHLLFAERFAWVAGKIYKDKLQDFATLAWAAWYCHNKEDFENAIVEPKEVATHFKKLVSDYRKYMAMTHEHQNKCGRSSVPGNGASFGVVIRDDRGKLLAAAVKTVRAN